MTYIFLARGFEEIEALTAVDMMRRAGIQIRTVSLMESKMVYGAQDIGVEADLLFGECDFAHCRMMILPGGYEGTMNMMNHREFLMRLKEYAESGGFVAAICAAPMVLARASVLGGHEATIYDGMESELLDASYVKRDVVVSGNVVTARGPGLATEFASKLIEILAGRDALDEVRRGMLIED